LLEFLLSENAECQMKFELLHINYKVNIFLLYNFINYFIK